MSIDVIHTSRYNFCYYILRIHVAYLNTLEVILMVHHDVDHSFAEIKFNYTRLFLKNNSAMW